MTDQAREPRQGRARNPVRRARAHRGPGRGTGARRPGDHLLQHRQPPGAGAEAAHLRAPDPGPGPVPGTDPDRRRPVPGRRAGNRPGSCWRAPGTAWAPIPKARACASCARPWPGSSASGTASTADPEAIYLTDGASKGVQAALRMLIGAPSDGIMIPIPQYPLYSATITLYEGRQVNFYMDEANDWKLSQAMLESSLREAEGPGRQGARHLRHQPGQPHRLGHGPGQHRHGHPLRQGARPGHPGRRGLPGERLPGRATASSPSPRCSTELEEKDVQPVQLPLLLQGLPGRVRPARRLHGDPQRPRRRGGPDPQAAERGPVRQPHRADDHLLPGQPAQPGQPSYAAVRRGAGRHPGRTEAARRDPGRGAQQDPRHPVQQGGRRHVLLPRVTLPARPHRRRLLHEPSWRRPGICVVPGSGFGQARAPPTSAPPSCRPPTR